MIIKTKVLTTTDKQNLSDEQANNARSNIKAQGKLITDSSSNVTLTDVFDDDGKYIGQKIVADGTARAAGTDITIDDGEVSVDTTGSNTGAHSFVAGESTLASGKASVALGNGTVANSASQVVFGEYNIPDDDKGTERGTYVEIVGNGTAEQASNIRTLTWNGDETIAGDLYFAYEETKEPVSLRTLIQQLSSTRKFEVVEELPETGKTNVIYLVKDTTKKSGDVYKEYIYYKDTSTDPPTYSWLQIGDTSIDLSNYLTTSDVDQTYSGTSANPQSGVALAAELSKFLIQVTAMPETPTTGMIVQYVGDTGTYENGKFYRFDGIQWVEVNFGETYTNGNGIAIDSATYAISVKLVSGSALTFNAQGEIDDSALKPWIGTKAELDALETTEDYKLYCTTDE